MPEDAALGPADSDEDGFLEAPSDSVNEMKADVKEVQVGSDVKSQFGDKKKNEMKADVKKE